MKYSAIALIVFSLLYCYRPRETRLHWLLDMQDSHAVEAQEEDYTQTEVFREGYTRGADELPAWGGDHSGIRVPPEGATPRNYAPYRYAQADIEKAGAELRNPVPRTAEALARGKDRYEIYCGVCHGLTGKGDGPVTPRYSIAVPAFSTADAPTREWSDGKIFHLMTTGRGAMKGYAAQIEPADRWTIVHYIRALQAQK
ncbi:MAG: cytochrome c [Spirochaetales bacterium]|nr:cytochrome c [Spirochaetales bacterium]